MTRLIFLAAAGLALANAVIILVSAFMLDGGALIISAVVAVLFVAIAGLLVVVDRHLARLRRFVSDGGIDQAASRPAAACPRQTGALARRRGPRHWLDHGCRPDGRPATTEHRRGRFWLIPQPLERPSDRHEHIGPRRIGPRLSAFRLWSQSTA